MALGGFSSELTSLGSICLFPFPEIMGNTQAAAFPFHREPVCLRALGASWGNRDEALEVPCSKTIPSAFANAHPLFSLQLCSQYLLCLASVVMLFTKMHVITYVAPPQK